MARPRGCASASDRTARPGHPARRLDIESLGARGIAWPWVLGERRPRSCVCACAQLTGRRPDRTRLLGLRACGCAPRAEGTWLGEWFRVLSQAFDANRRVQRASCCADSTASCRFESARRVDPAHRGLRVAAASHCSSKTVASRRRLIRIVSCACRSRHVRTDLIIGFGSFAWVGIGSSCAPRAANECFAGRSGRSVCRGWLRFGSGSACGGASPYSLWGAVARSRISQHKLRTHVLQPASRCSRRVASRGASRSSSCAVPRGYGVVGSVALRVSRSVPSGSVAVLCGLPG